jgi:hypothetical protein
VSHSRGTSNAAALASRAATLAFEVIETLRPAAGNAISLAHDAVLLKALLVHGASWAELSPPLVARRPDIAQAERKNFLARCLGYGLADVTRALECAAERATLIATGEMTLERALVFAAPLPPSLAGKTAWRRLTLTLAWLSPINPSHQAYRRAKLSVTPPSDTLQVRRENSVNDKAAQRGTVQHEILEGDSAVAFIDGAQLVCKVSCAARAGSLADPIPFALCLTLETRDDSGIPVYEEIRARIATQVQVQAG